MQPKRPSNDPGGLADGAPVLPLARLFDCEVVVAQAVPAIVDDALYSDELAYVARAVTRRRAEFGTVRVCARRALAELGIGPCSLVPGPDRSPRWPPGVVGSISHTDGYCAVAVARSSQADGLGLDVEHAGSLPDDLEAIVCTTAERAWLDQREEERGHLIQLVFCAKEAFYKCEYPVTRSPLDFLDVELRIDLDAETFSVARVHRSGATWRATERARGRLFRCAGFVVTAATL
jgi:4'-phosphopantetheinyl transferase EntD